SICNSKFIHFSVFFFRGSPLQCPLTGKVFAKGGLNLTASSISTERSKLLFQITKLQKKSNMKSKLRLKATGSSFITSTPPFANTMLAVVLFIQL
ncbi:MULTISPECIES: hypothetical protein, partial [unclassified Elizabethkingia]|uniref:hypothetical protein n=1 Tax=unclassified Elizabethkingia TaxID=2685307 RepID=UPI002A248CD0